jgi:CBS domain-containing protein
VTRLSPARALLARDIMSSPLFTLSADDTMRQAAGLFLDKNISGAHVVDAAGAPVGVLTKTDIIRYERFAGAERDAELRDAMRTLDTLEVVSHGAHADDRVARWMTPRVIAVEEDTPISEVGRNMAAKKIHRVFVRERKTRRLAGVITSFDLIRYVGTPEAAPGGKERTS